MCEAGKEAFSLRQYTLYVYVYIMYALIIITVYLSVYPSVRLSLTPMICVKMTEYQTLTFAVTCYDVTHTDIVIEFHLGCR